MVDGVIAELREAGFEHAASVLEDLWFAQIMLERNADYMNWLNYWRNKNGKGNLTYPDAKEIYSEFWSLMNECLLLRQQNEVLRHQVDRYRDKIGFLGLEERSNSEGYWIYDKDGNDWGIGAYRCSECDCKNDNLGITKSPFNVMNFAGSKYCPHCGVKMIGEKKNE